MASRCQVHLLLQAAVSNTLRQEQVSSAWRLHWQQGPPQALVSPSYHCVSVNLHLSAFTGRMYARADRFHYSHLRYDGACRPASINMRLLLCKLKVCTEPFCVQDRVCLMRSLSWSSSSAQVIFSINKKSEASRCLLKHACNNSVCSCEQAHA